MQILHQMMSLFWTLVKHSVCAGFSLSSESCFVKCIYECRSSTELVPLENKLHMESSAISFSPWLRMVSFASLGNLS